MCEKLFLDYSLQVLSKFDIISLMNRRNQKTFDAIKNVPTRANINFSDIEKLLVALGAKVFEGSGSRVAFELGGQKLSMHRPHPAKEAKRYQVEDVREILKRTGI